MQGQLWVERVGELIVARVRGEPDSALLKECQERVLKLVQERGGQGKVLYDTLELEAPPVEVPLAQWKLDASFGDLQIRRAVVVPDSRLAYLARLAFGGREDKVFYNDISAAVAWLNRL